jgi:hypothetical protein
MPTINLSNIAQHTWRKGEELIGEEDKGKGNDTWDGGCHHDWVVAPRVRRRVITPGLKEATRVRQKRDETSTGEMCNQGVAWPLLLAVVEAEGVAE